MDKPESAALHIAICQAVALMNNEIQEGGNAQAHHILRQALADYADASDQPTNQDEYQGWPRGLGAPFDGG